MRLLIWILLILSFDVFSAENYYYKGCNKISNFINSQRQTPLIPENGCSAIVKHAEGNAIYNAYPKEIKEMIGCALYADVVLSVALPKDEPLRVEYLEAVKNKDRKTLVTIVNALCENVNLSVPVWLYQE